MATFTVKEIAAKIKRPMEPLQAAVDRLRNWTKEGLISTSGERHPGTGRARQYSQKALVDAVLLQALTDGTGISAVSAAPILKDAKKHISDRPLTTVRSFLIISRSAGGQGFTMGIASSGGDLLQWFNRNNQDTHIIVDLNRFFVRIGKLED